MSTYAISQTFTTSTSIGIDWLADNQGTFNVRVSIANQTTGATILGSTVIAANGGFDNGTVFSEPLSPNTTYTFVMTVRRASNFEQLGTRTITASTNPAPPPPTIWYASGCCSTSGAVFGNSSASSSAAIDNLEAQCGGVVSNVTVTSATGPFNSANYPPVDCSPPVQNGTVPNVVGQTQGDASFLIQNAGFSPNGTTTTSGATSGNSGTVASQSPAGGTTLQLGSTVNFVVFNFVPPPVTVPNVLGQAQASAVANIQNVGLQASVSTTTSGATSGNNGTVASQSPGGGSSVQQGSTVSIVVFNFIPPSGTVPNVVGQVSSTAVSTLQNAGFGVSSSLTTSGATSGNNGTVASQSPTGGSTATLGSTVSIVVFNFIPPTVTVPNVVGQTQAQATSTLQGAGFGVSTTVTTSGANSSNNGTVASQSPTGGSSANSGSTVTISIFTFNPPVWTDNVIVNTFVLGTSYSDSVSATNSPSYSITSGSLPAGISINSVTGAITGTPTTAGSYSFVISATNSFGSVSVSYSGTVTAVPVWSDQALADFLQGRAYSDGVVATNSPTYSVTAGTLPAGISLNSATGAVTGTPTGTGAYSFTISAANSFGTITATFSGNIKLPPNWIDNQLGSFINGVAYSDSVAASNSPTYSVSAGTLPVGISIASSTGVLSGTPTGSVGTNFSFTITATNTDGSISQAFTGSIQPDLGGNLKLFANGVWSDKEVYVYDGATWVRGTVHIFNGTAWSKSVF